MAKITQMPAIDVVKTLRGKLDFYKWCNLTIVRSWPDKTTAPRSDYAIATSEKFTYIGLQASTVDPAIKPAYELLASASKYTWKDWQVSLWYKGTTRLHLIPEE